MLWGNCHTRMYIDRSVHGTNFFLNALNYLVILFAYCYAMTQTAYPYRKVRLKRYVFVSVGKKRIEKAVDFIDIGENLVNLAFGDLSPDGSIDDTSISNNGDIVKVLSTVVDILRNFTGLDPNVAIYFRGSTPERTKLYARILRSYHTVFCKEFKIGGFIWLTEESKLISFDPNMDWEYHAFLIKRIS